MEDWEVRFWEKVDKGDKNDCWEWQGYVNPQGYGSTRKRKGATHHTAHRLAYESEYGYQPDYVLHKCDNRLCVNPNHLKEGTQSENIKEAYERGEATQEGEDNSCAKLREKDVKDILRRVDKGETQRDLADEYDVHPPAISRIVNGKRWEHVSINGENE